MEKIDSQAVDCGDNLRGARAALAPMCALILCACADVVEQNSPDSAGQFDNCPAAFAEDLSRIGSSIRGQLELVDRTIGCESEQFDPSTDILVKQGEVGGTATYAVEAGLIPAQNYVTRSPIYFDRDSGVIAQCIDYSDPIGHVGIMCASANLGEDSSSTRFFIDYKTMVRLDASHSESVIVDPAPPIWRASAFEVNFSGVTSFSFGKDNCTLQKSFDSTTDPNSECRRRCEDETRMALLVARKVQRNFRNLKNCRKGTIF